MTDARQLESGTLRGLEAGAFHALESYTGGAVVYSDNFDRADAASLGAGWSDPDSSFSIVSNQAVHFVTGGGVVAFATNVGGLDMWAEVDVYEPSLVYQLITVRTSPGDLNTNYSGFTVPTGNNVPTTLVTKIGRQFGGYSDVNTSSAISVPSNPARIRLEAQGAVQRFYVNGVLVLTGADTATMTGTYAGLTCAGSGSGGHFDNFRCGLLPYTP